MLLQQRHIQRIPKVPIIQAQANSNGSIIQTYANPKLNISNLEGNGK
jgi:hypothetical protein